MHVEAYTRHLKDPGSIPGTSTNPIKAVHF